MNSTTSKKARVAALAAAAGIGLTTLIGVGAANAAPNKAQPAPVTAAAPAKLVVGQEPSVSTYQGKSEMRLQNDTDHVLIITIYSPEKNANVKKELQPGESVKFSGTGLSRDRDIAAAIQYPNSNVVSVWAWDEEADNPAAGLAWFSYDTSGPFARFTENMTKSMKFNDHQFDFERGDDVNGYKYFDVYVKS